jgi:uncharacterized protein YbjT (DUF2867 family)
MMKQKVFIVGITGGTGLRLARLLKDRGDEVAGLYRRHSQGSMLGAIGITGTLGDIVQVDIRQLAEDIRGSDVVVYTAGAGDQDSDAMIDAIDGEGVVKSIAAAGLAGVRRFLLVSVFPEAGRREGFGESFEHYIVVKKQADVALTQADLDWVILRPSTLTDEPGTGAVSLGPAQFHTEIPRDDVAATIVELIHAPAVRRKILELTGGSTPIERAVSMQV